MRVQADLQLDVDPGVPQGGGGLGISIRSESDDVLHVRLDRVPDLDARPSPDLIRSVADGLQGQGLKVVVEGPGGRLVSVGAGVRTPWWQRPFIRARHVRVHDLRAALRTLPRRGSTAGAITAPPAMLFTPPTTMLPLAPTVLRRQRVSTTHDPTGGGLPRLYFPPEDSAGSRLKVFYLRPVITVGDRADADLRLPGVAPVQAVIRRNDRDEYVIEPQPDGLPIRVHGSLVLRPTQLRTGARIEIGSWRMVYFRAEYADHGRPYGGRQGGEIDQQQWQPPARYRPDIGESTSGGSGG
ncbi:FHA domain-containing protein [Microlunatus aurantiacus]|uniref:FHA domain-containing protein n=1 Tax=Microlunatus aurantiacus TaxID=446786 RepID=UPI0031D905A8